MVTTLKDLTPDLKNRRRHTSRNVEMITEAIASVGTGRSIVIDEDDVVLAGNATVKAAGVAGLTKLKVVEAAGDEVIAVRRRGLSSEQKRALAIYDNRTAELAEWDVEQLVEDVDAGLDLGAFFEPVELDELLPPPDVEGLTDPDTVPEPRATDIKVGDLFTLGDHRLLCGDSTTAEDVARVMDGEKADMVFSDPPYALFGNSTGISGVTDDKMVRPFFRDIFKVCRSTSKRFAHIYICCDWHSAFAIQSVSQEVGVTAKNLMVWDKGDGGLGSMYQHCYEFVWFFSNTPTSKAINKKISGERTVTGVSNIWRFPRMSPDKQHAAQKPVALVSVGVQGGSDPGELVADWFCGSGTTIIAAEQLGRKCYAIEIEPSYCQVTIDRWEAFTGKTANKVT